VEHLRISAKKEGVERKQSLQPFEPLAKVVSLVKTGIQFLTNPKNLWISAYTGMTGTGL